MATSALILLNWKIEGAFPVQIAVRNLEETLVYTVFYEALSKSTSKALGVLGVVVILEAAIYSGGYPSLKKRMIPNVSHLSKPSFLWITTHYWAVIPDSPLLLSLCPKFRDFSTKVSQVTQLCKACSNGGSWKSNVETDIIVQCIKILYIWYVLKYAELSFH